MPALMRAILIGPRSTGKTTFCFRRLTLPNHVLPDQRRPSYMHHLHMGIFRVDVPGTKLYGSIGLSDTMGLDTNQFAINRTVLRGYDMVVYTCDVTRRDSLERLSGYVKHVRDLLGEDWGAYHHCLLATHADMPRDKWELGLDDMYKFTSEHPGLRLLKGLETISAKDFDQVFEVTAALFRCVYEVRRDPFTWQQRLVKRTPTTSSTTTTACHHCSSSSSSSTTTTRPAESATRRSSIKLTNMEGIGKKTKNVGYYTGGGLAGSGSSSARQQQENGGEQDCCGLG